MPEFTLRQWRKLSELSQEEMAKRLNIHINTYRNWEDEPEKITIANADKIAEVLGVNKSQIIFAKNSTKC